MSCPDPRRPEQLIVDWNPEKKIATHRGYGKRGPVPENTIEAFEKSTEEGFYYHELDVRATAEKDIIIFHGPDLASTTSGRGRVERKSRQELEAIDWGAYLQKKSRTPAPWLEIYLKKIAPRVITNIELKRDWYDFSRGLEENTARLVKESHNERRVFVSSFNILALRRFQKISPDIGVGLLVEPGFLFRFRLWLLSKMVCYDFIHPPEEECTPERIRAWKSKGYSVHVWTVDSPERARELLNLGVDLVITNNMRLPQEI